MDKKMRKFYSRTSNTGVTDVVYCILTQHGEPALFEFLEAVKSEANELYKKYKKGELTGGRILGLTETEKLIKKYQLT